jgi:hypothetical protein
MRSNDPRSSPTGRSARLATSHEEKLDKFADLTSKCRPISSAYAPDWVLSARCQQVGRYSEMRTFAAGSH